MGTGKMDASTVYALFEELKQKIEQLGKDGVSDNLTNSTFDTEEIAALMQELRNHLKPKQFSSEQIKELQKSMAQISAYSLNMFSDNIRGLSTELKATIISIEEKVDQLKTPQNTVIRKEHVFILDFRRSKTALTIITMALIILLSWVGNIWQLRKNNQLKDNDLKYRYIKMEGKANSRDLLRLETIFSYDRNRDSISVIREQVENYERLVKEHVKEFKRKELKTSTEHTGRK
jgi:hypothetical protein